jgi:hypothetical protein
MSDVEKGLYEKFSVERRDGSSNYPGKHYGCNYFVLDLKHDEFAIPALEAYALACSEKFPMLALDLHRKIQELKAAKI